MKYLTKRTKLYTPSANIARNSTQNVYITSEKLVLVTDEGLEPPTTTLYTEDIFKDDHAALPTELIRNKINTCTYSLHDTSPDKNGKPGLF